MSGYGSAAADRGYIDGTVRRSEVTRSAGNGSLPLACVMGDINLVRALALAGVDSAAVVEPGNPARYSRSTVACWTDRSGD